MRKSRFVAGAVGALAATVIVVGVAYAGIPGSDGTINGCYLKVTGGLRVIDPAKNEKCLPALETALSWNSKGVKGDPGAPGAAGAPGTPGAPGAPGAQGLPGKDGASGSPGLPGKDGVDGKNGEPGAPGKDGTNGQDGVPCLPTNPACVGPKGDPGAPGQPGQPGEKGTPGADGKDGVSVTSAVEPNGANCANGGSKFTSTSGTTYACNGADGGSGGGPTGQDAISAYGTGSLTTTTFTFADVPGLTTTVNVPANSVLYISTDGGISPALTATSASTSVIVDVALFIDGTVSRGGFTRVSVLDNGGVWQQPTGSWSLALTAPLTPGNHTIKVQARLAGSLNAPGGAIVSSGDSTILQGSLNVLTIAK